jgi:hypothetical protein
VLRGIHLVAVIHLGVGVLGVSTAAAASGGLAVLFSGLALWALDIWQKPGHLREVAGLSMFLKLALVAWMILAPGLQRALFWLIVIWSAIFSHAPASFRNALWRPQR